MADLRLRLRLLTGAPGAGKSTLLAHLRHGPFTVVDFDELLDADGSLLGIEITSADASAVWPAYAGEWSKPGIEAAFTAVVDLVVRGLRP